MPTSIPADSPAGTPHATTDQLFRTAVRSLEERLRGEVVRPGDDEYDQARRVWNAAVDRHPALIVRPRDVADVIAGRQLRPHQRRCRWRCAAAGTVRPGTAPSTAGWSSTSRA